MRIISEMDQSSAEVVAEFPERGVHWVKEQVEAVLSETEIYVRLCRRIHFESAAVGPNCRRPPSAARRRFETRDLDLRRRQIVPGGAGRRIVNC